LVKLIRFGDKSIQHLSCWRHFGHQEKYEVVIRTVRWRECRADPRATHTGNDDFFKKYRLVLIIKHKDHLVFVPHAYRRPRRGHEAQTSHRERCHHNWLDFFSGAQLQQSSRQMHMHATMSTEIKSGSKYCGAGTALGV